MGERQRGVTPNANGPVFYVNEHATGLRTNNPEVVGQFQELRNEFPTHKLLFTSGNPFTDIAALRAIVQSGDVVAVIGGDSTVGLAVAALAHHQLKFGLHQLEHPLDARLSKCAQSPEIGTADADGFRSQR